MNMNCVEVFFADKPLEHDSIICKTDTRFYIY